MIDRHSMAERLDAALSNGVRFTDPYLMYMYSPFAPELYDEMLTHIPDDDAQWLPSFHPDAILPDGRHVRYLLPLTSARMDKVNTASRSFWLEFANEFGSDDVRDVYKRYLEPELKQRWKVPLSEIVAIPKPCLLRDYSGYSIRPHPDSATKVMTTQYYLPSDESQIDLGTSFYIRRGPGDYKTVRKANFLPNQAYCFAVGDKSFHGVGVVPETNKPRDTLIMIYFREEGHEY